MSDEKKWQERYQNEQTPWDTGRPDSHLIRTVFERFIQPCKTLEIGCGSGNSAIWLAQNGFYVTGVDISATAIEKAMENAKKADVCCEFVAMDFLNDKIASSFYDFVYDRGCFHSFNTDEERTRFAENVAFHLKEKGLWLSLVGSTDDPPREPGPPRRSARDIVIAVEPFFEIISLTASYFDSNHPKPPRSWTCLMRKRV